MNKQLEEALARATGRLDAVLAGEPRGTGVTPDRAVLAFAGTDLPAYEVLMLVHDIARRVGWDFIESIRAGEDNPGAEVVGGLFEMLLVGYELGRGE